MLRNILGGIVLIVILMAIAAFATAPPELLNETPVHQISGDLDEWLATSEREISEANSIIPGTEKRIRWYQGSSNIKTPYSVVYFHGFSATRQEIAPVGDLVADALQANLFETRLTGHGQRRNALVGVRAEDWLDDAAEALAIGEAIGNEIIVMGTSTGATLALAMTDHPSFRKVSHIILISPNFATRDSNSEFLTWPGGPQLASVVVGDTHSWTARNEEQALYWSTSYPMDALVEMMRLVNYVRHKLPLRIEQSLLAIYSPADQVVDTERIIREFELANSPRKRLIAIPSTSDPGSHVLAGDIMSPENNGAVAEHIIRFVTAVSQ
jgi:esterase/lipase